MKRKITMSAASFLAISSLTPVAFADSINTIEQNPVENEIETEQSEESKKLVQQLTLEEAIEYALKSNYSLMELDYALKSLRLSEEEAEENYDDLKDTLWDLEDEKDRLEDYYDNLINPPEEPPSEEEPTDEEPPVEEDDSLQEQLGRLNNSLASLDSNLTLHNIARTAQNTNKATVASSTLEGNIDYLKDVLQTTEESVDEFEQQEEHQKQITDTSQAINGIREQLNSIEGTIKTLENSLKQIESGIKTTQNTRKQVEESIKFSITASFISLLLSQNQIDFMETTLNTQQQKVKGMERRYELGLMSYKDFKKSTRDITQLEFQIKQAKNALKGDKEAFALTIGYSYENDYEVVEPETSELKLVSKETSLTEIINNSYNMKNAKEELNLAFETLSDVEDDDDDSNDIKVRKANLEVDIKQLKVKSLQKELENSINKLYSQIQLQYETMQDHELKLAYVEEDSKDTLLYYQLGLISKEQYDLATITSKEAEFNYNQSKYQYYLLLKQEELLKSGVIITN